MKETLRKYKRCEGSKFSKFSRLLLIIILTSLYLYCVLIWTPETFVTILGTNKIFMYFRILATLLLAIYIAVQLDLNVMRSPKFSRDQIKDYELWNKFFLHFAFLKTGSGSEKAQIQEVLRYLEDSELKQTLTEVYEETTTLKEAHTQIVEKYPYPHIKTFFAEAEDALVRGADGNKLMQKTALHIDKYINDITCYEDNKTNSYYITFAMLVTTVVLTVVAKLLFADTFINVCGTYSGFLGFIIYFLILTRLFVKAKIAVNRPLLHFGGNEYE